MTPTLRVGLVGCGKISDTYLSAPYNEIAYQYVACADLDRERAEQTAKRYGLRAMPVQELLSDPEIDVICNLTVPQAHAEVSLASLGQGKHVYVEKPLATDRSQAQAILELAGSRGLRVGCAPDTFLGPGLQTCRAVIDDGKIGTPIAAVACMANHGHEHWHPDPTFYYQRGGGPLFDMGPYYLTALVSLLGPVRRVSAGARGTGTVRTVPFGPRAGELLHVEVPTHMSGTAEFASGTLATILMSFDVWRSDLPRLEIHGSEGSLSLPDPNTFGGPVRLFEPGGESWEEVAVDGFGPQQRGASLADLARATSSGQPHRASGEL